MSTGLVPGAWGHLLLEQRPAQLRTWMQSVGSLARKVTTQCVTLWWGPEWLPPFYLVLSSCPQDVLLLGNDGRIWHLQGPRLACVLNDRLCYDDRGLGALGFETFGAPT